MKIILFTAYFLLLIFCILYFIIILTAGTYAVFYLDDYMSNLKSPIDICKNSNLNIFGAILYFIFYKIILNPFGIIVYIIYKLCHIGGNKNG